VINRTYLLDSVPAENPSYRVEPVKLRPGNPQRIRLTVLARKIREAAERDDVARELQRRKNLTVLTPLAWPGPKRSQGSSKKLEPASQVGKTC
jgi:hypothetical protein